MPLALKTFATVNDAGAIALKGGANCAFGGLVDDAFGVGVGVAGRKIAHGSMLAGDGVG